MGRTIETIDGLSSPLLDGQSSMVKFYDLAKPIDGGWLLTVNLAKDGDCAVVALVELLQDQTQIGGELVVLKSATFHPTTTAANDSLEITEDDLRKTARGRCHVSQLKVRVKAISDCVESLCCCAGVPLPKTLNVDVSGTGCVDFTTTLTWNGTRWEGRVTVCTIEMIVYAYCDANDECRFHVQGDYPQPMSSFLFSTQGFTPTCAPFSGQIHANMYPSYAHADCCPNVGYGLVTLTA